MQQFKSYEIKMFEMIKSTEKKLAAMERTSEETFLNMYKSQMSELQK